MYDPVARRARYLANREEYIQKVLAYYYKTEYFARNTRNLKRRIERNTLLLEDMRAGHYRDGEDNRREASA